MGNASNGRCVAPDIPCTRMNRHTFDVSLLALSYPVHQLPSAQQLPHHNKLLWCHSYSEYIAFCNKVCTFTSSIPVPLPICDLKKKYFTAICFVRGVIFTALAVEFVVLKNSGLDGHFCSFAQVHLCGYFKQQLTGWNKLLYCFT
jgi:hypothetical protein